jgi:polyhydroxyalkanoate synthase subunit PhaC
MLHKRAVNLIYNIDRVIPEDSFSTINSNKDNLSAPSTKPRAKNNVNFMDPYAGFKILCKLMEIYTIGSGLNFAYNSAYLKAFEQASAIHDEADWLADIEGSEENNSNTDTPLFYDTWLTLSDDYLDKELKSTTFISLLSYHTDSLVELHSIIRQAGYPVYSFRSLVNSYVKSFAKFSSSIQNNNFDLAPHDIIFARGKARLLHYYHDSSNSGKEEIAMDHKYQQSESQSSLPPSASLEQQQQRRPPPVIITYAPINRFQIMDINPYRSVVRALLSRGLDVYLLDWGYPHLEDSSLSLSDYVNYLKDAIQTIKDKTGFYKISMLAYCWGGIIGTIYAALNNDNLKSLVLMAVPIDSSKDNTIIARWLKALDVDKMINEFDSIDGLLLELAFIMRNPPRYAFDRYARFYSRLYDKVFVKTFAALQNWLTDTPPIPGNLFRNIINDCYKNNLLISNRMQINGDNNDNNIIDLMKITVPLLTIVAEHDDLVSPESTLSIKSLVSSTEKTSFVNPGDHIGLCISRAAHERLWPEVSEWILSHSKQ